MEEAEEGVVEPLMVESEDEEDELELCRREAFGGEVRPLLLLLLLLLLEESVPLEKGVEEPGVLEGGEGDGSSSMIIISGSDSGSESAVRSITSSWMLSLAAFSASRLARAPDAQAFSSRALRSAAYGEITR